MKLLKAASAIFCVASAVTILTPTVFGQEPDTHEKTTVTFSGPVEIPGVHLKGFRTLPAGTYVFKLVDSMTNRYIVQIQSADQKKTYATIMAIANSRIKPTGKTVITFGERPNGEPPALRAWFFPGADYGEEFVYGKKVAKELAASNKTPVLYSNDENQQAEVNEVNTPTPDEVKQMDNTQVVAANPSGDDLNLDQAVTAPDNNTTAQNTNVAPAGNAEPAPVQVADAAPASTYTPPAPSSTTSSAPATLPQTASPFGFILLSGLFALGGAVSVQRIRQRA